MNIQQVSALPPIEKSTVGVDIETTGGYKDPYRDRILSLQVSDGETAWILKDNFVSAIPLLTNPDVKKIGQNLSFELKYFKHHLGIDTVNIYDTLMAERILTAGDLGRGNALDEILARRFGIFTDKSIRDQFKDHTGPFTQEQLEYMAKDVLYLERIREKQLVDIANLGMGRVLQLENALVPVVSQMELDGIGFDRELWFKNQRWVYEQIAELDQKISKYIQLPVIVPLFGNVEMGINLGSPDQVEEYLNRRGMQLTDTNEKTLIRKVISLDPASHEAVFIRDILKRRGLLKLLMKYHEHVNPITGNIHTEWNQIKADTGRFSSSNPNLQNVKRPEKGEPNFREAFLPDPGCVFVIADYSQQEVRIMAQISHDEKLMRAAENSDVYSQMGEVVYNKPTPKGSKERDVVKTVILGDAYGLGAEATAERLGVTLERANEIKEDLRRSFPVLYGWFDQQGYKVAQYGYVETLLGRRRWVLDARGADQKALARYKRIARNMPIQGTGADTMKMAMVRFSDWLKENNYNDVRIKLQVHDELVVQSPPDKAEEIKYQLVGAMESCMAEVCPDVLPGVDAGISEKWSKV